MRIYVEALEILPADSMEEPDFIRIDVTDMTETEVKEVIKTVEELMANVEHYLMLHFCHHDEDPMKPCEIQMLK